MDFEKMLEDGKIFWGWAAHHFFEFKLYMRPFVFVYAYPTCIIFHRGDAPT